ncbi:MAG: DUF6175 family protein [Bacteroidota bacterium]
MKLKLLTATIWLLIGSVVPLRAQEALQVQPTIMVIPFTKESEDIRTVLESDFNKRIAVTKVKEAFDNRGFSTIDFVAKLKEANARQALKGDDQTSVKQQIISYSGADVYVEVDIFYHESSTGNSVKVIVTAYESSSALSLSNKTGDSGKFITTDVAALCERAIKPILEDFLNVIQTKFNDVVKNGRFVAVEFSLAQGSTFDMGVEVGENGLQFAYAVYEWLEQKTIELCKQSKSPDECQGGYVSSPNMTDIGLNFEQVRIPLKIGQGNQVLNFSAMKFAQEISKYCTSVKVKINLPTVRGNTILITIK